MNSEHVEYKELIPIFMALSIVIRRDGVSLRCHRRIRLYEKDIPYVTSSVNRVSMVTRIAINDPFLGTMWINCWPADPEIVKPFPNVLLEW